MTRKDYDYVKKATALCLCTTDRGHAWLAEQLDRPIVDAAMDRDLIDLLAMCEQDYIIVEDPAGITAIKIVIDHVMEHEYEVPDRVSTYTISQAFIMGWLGLHLVIWDSS
jgi:hypothetical protein